MADNYLARKDGEWIVVGILPDVCYTPVGAIISPIPYPVIAKLDEAVKVVSSVRANGKPLVVLSQSLLPTTLGDQAGVACGIKSGTVGGSCYPKQHSKSVYAGKKFVLRHNDEFWMNGK